MNADICAPTAMPPAAADLAAAEAAYRRHALEDCLAAASRAWQAAGGASAGRPADAAQARAGFLLAHCLYRLGRFDELLACHEAVVGGLRSTGQVGSACQVLRWIALGVPEVGHFDAGLRAARLGLQLAEAHGLDGARVLLGNALAACFERMGDPWQAERLLLDALALATERCGDEERFVCLNNLCAVSLTRFDLMRDGADGAAAEVALRRAKDFACEAEPIARRLGDPFYRAYIEANLGDALCFLGQHDEAQAWLIAALERTQAQHFGSLRWRVLCSLGELAVERGRMIAARELLQPLIKAMGRAAPQVTQMRAQRALCRALRALGDPLGALDAFDRFHALQRRRSVAQLQAQAEHLVTRLEIERSRRETQAQLERANALEEAAIRDPLTGLLNRRGCERSLHDLMQGAGHGAPPIVAMVDIDQFKAINDAHGHPAGDAVLAKVARLLREHVRPGDLAGRIGGEEFLMVWAGIDRARAVEIAQRLRAAIEACDWSDVAAGLRVSVSVGVAGLGLASPSGQLGALLADADRALYRAKRKGRNRVEAASPAC